MSITAYRYRKAVHIMTEKACEYGRHAYEKSQEVGIFIQQHGRYTVHYLRTTVHHLRSFAHSARDKHPIIYNYAVKILLGTTLCTLVWNAPFFPLAQAFSTDRPIGTSILVSSILTGVLFFFKIHHAAQATAAIASVPVIIASFALGVYSLVARRSIKVAIVAALICIGTFYSSICIGTLHFLPYLVSVIIYANPNNLEKPVTNKPHRFTKTIKFLLKSIAIIEIVTLPLLAYYHSLISVFSLSGKIVGVCLGVDFIAQLFLQEIPFIHNLQQLKTRFLLNLHVLQITIQIAVFHEQQPQLQPVEALIPGEEEEQANLLFQLSHLGAIERINRARDEAQEDVQFIEEAIEHLQVPVKDDEGKVVIPLDVEYRLFSDDESAKFEEDLAMANANALTFLPRIVLYHFLSKLHSNEALYIPRFISQQEHDDCKILEESWTKIQNQFLQLDQELQPILLGYVLNNTPIKADDSIIMDLVTDIRTLASKIPEGNAYLNGAMMRFFHS